MKCDVMRSIFCIFLNVMLLCVFYFLLFTGIILSTSHLGDNYMGFPIVSFECQCKSLSFVQELKVLLFPVQELPHEILLYQILNQVSP